MLEVRYQGVWVNVFEISETNLAFGLGMDGGKWNIHMVGLTQTLCGNFGPFHAEFFQCSYNSEFTFPLFKPFRDFDFWIGQLHLN